MVNGLKFNGVHCRSLHLYVSSAPRPLLPDSQDQYEQIPKRSGSIIIPNMSKNDIEISVDFSLDLPNGIPLHAAIRNIRTWLDVDERKQLIFDDDPGYAYVGKYITTTNVEKLIRYGKFTVVFRCLPDMVEVG